MSNNLPEAYLESLDLCNSSLWGDLQLRRLPEPEMAWVLTCRSVAMPETQTKTSLRFLRLVWLVHDNEVKLGYELRISPRFRDCHAQFLIRTADLVIPICLEPRWAAIVPSPRLTGGSGLVGLLLTGELQAVWVWR